MYITSTVPKEIVSRVAVDVHLGWWRYGESGGFQRSWWVPGCILSARKGTFSLSTTPFVTPKKSHYSPPTKPFRTSNHQFIQHTHLFRPFLLICSFACCLPACLLVSTLTAAAAASFDIQRHCPLSVLPTDSSFFLFFNSLFCFCLGGLSLLHLPPLGPLAHRQTLADFPPSWLRRKSGIFDTIRTLAHPFHRLCAYSSSGCTRPLSLWFFGLLSLVVHPFVHFAV